MSQGYQTLATAYDGLMADVQYSKRLRYLRGLLRRANRSVHTVVDIGCGTGTIACGLAQAGYQVMALDPSEEMLTQAMDKAMELESPPVFIQQTMERLSLPALTDAMVSTIDAVNYVTAPKALAQAFARMYRFLEPEGRLIFDVNTPHKYQTMDAQMYVDETEDTYCVWRTFFNAKQGICTYQVDLFAQGDGGAWEREFEQHRQRAYSQETLRQLLTDAGFASIAFYSDLTQDPAKEDDLRWIVVCDKGADGDLNDNDKRG